MLSPAELAFRAWPGRTLAAVKPLAGDASTRRYRRLCLSPAGSLVLAEYPPEGDSARSFLALQLILQRAGVRVPAVLWASDDERQVVLEDLGDEMLQNRLGRIGCPVLERFYPEALVALDRFHGTTREALAGGPESCRRRLDAERLGNELGFFHRHTLIGLLGRSPAPGQNAALERLYQGLAEAAGAPPWVLCHRDYHSRNLMVVGDELAVIDFQDAMLGHAVYDFVSLARDAYVDLAPGVRAGLWAKFARRAFPGEPAAALERRRVACAAQRTLKAAGTFGFQAAVRGRRAYLAYLPGVLRAALEELAGLPEWESERRLLASLIPERWRPAVG